ncbi:MAG: transporter [Ferruginibacter sp.]
MTLKYLLLIALFVAGRQTVFAQVDKIDTDRPDQTESAVTVPKKWFQFEVGFLRESNKNPAPNQQRFRDINFEHPSLLSKYGVTKFAELRSIITYATSRGKENSTIIDRQNGISNVELGAKVNFFKEKGLRPKTSLLAHYNFARLRTLYKDSIDGADFRFSMQHTINSVVSLGYNLGMEWERFGSPPAYIYTLAPGFNIGEKWYAYVEVFGFIWKDDDPENSIDGGIAYYVNDDLKLDISAGFGISKRAPDNYVAIGVSFRFKAGK